MPQIDSNKTVVHRGGIGCFSLMTIVLITLKLCNQIDWSWWWVLAPSWVPFVLVFLLSGFLLITAWFLGK